MKKERNPLFIYGSSGLGKTHLLRSIQNYIIENDPSRLCVYKNATSFIDDYACYETKLMAPQILTEAYQDIDVLIIDDVQKLAGKKAGTLSFFFDTFNSLKTDGNRLFSLLIEPLLILDLELRIWWAYYYQSELRIVIGIEQPSYEMKVNLINTFCGAFTTKLLQKDLHICKHAFWRNNSIWPREAVKASVLLKDSVIVVSANKRAEEKGKSIIVTISIDCLNRLAKETKNHYGY